MQQPASESTRPKYLGPQTIVAYFQNIPHFDRIAAHVVEHLLGDAMAQLELCNNCYKYAK